MASGSLQTNSWGNISIYMDWYQTSDIASNTSTITYNIKGMKTGGTKPWANVYHIKLWNGGTVVYQMDSTTKTYDGTSFASGQTFSVQHNLDGTASVHLWLEASIGTSGSPNCKDDYVWTLDTIPRSARVTKVDDFNDEQNCAVAYSNPAGKASTLSAIITKWNIETDYWLVDNWHTLGSEYSWDYIYLTENERTKIRTWLSDANSKKAYVYLKSDVGGYIEYSWASVNISIKDGAISINPKVTVDSKTIGLADNSSTIIRGLTDATYDLGASVKKGASLVSYSITCGSQSSSTATYGTFYAADSEKFTFTATDSRGNIATKTVTLNLIDYVPLTCTINSTNSAAGVLDITIQGQCYNYWLGEGAKAKWNNMELWYILKVDNDEGTWVKLTDITRSGNSYSATTRITGLDYTKKYQIQGCARDIARHTKIGTDVYSAIRDASCYPVFEWGKNDFTVNVPLFYPQAFPTYPANEAPEGVTGMGYFNRYGFCWSRFGNTAGKVCAQGDNYYLMVAIHNETSELEFWVGRQMNKETTITWAKH